MADYKHVVVIGVDGAGSFFRDTDIPNIREIFADGAVTYDMRVTAPTSSCPSWMSCLHGVNPEHHGLIENHFVEYFTYPSSEFRFPSFLRVYKEANPDAEVVALYNWIGIKGIIENDAGIVQMHMGDDRIAEYLTVEYLPRKKPDLLYVHFGRTDSMGHAYGYGSNEHLMQISITDRFIGQIYYAMQDNGMLDDTLFIVTSDHGGFGRWHGGLTDEEKYVMFAARGKTVEKNGIPTKMEIRDVASVVLHALGIKQPECYTGRVPTGLFRDVFATERPVYYDPKSPRYHIPEPTRDTEGFVRENIAAPLLNYYPFDKKNFRDLEIHDTVSLGEGYFDKAVVLDDGYLTMDSFDPDKSSFTLAAWIKTPSPHSQEVVFANLPVRGFTEKLPEELIDGFVLTVIRNTFVIPPVHTTRLDLVSNGRAFNVEAALPTDFQFGWVHLAMVVDREKGIISLYHDFKKVASTLAWGLRKGNPLSGVRKGIVVGQDGVESCETKCGLSMDELMVFGGALTDEDLAKLAQYYKK